MAFSRLVRSLATVSAAIVFVSAPARCGGIAQSRGSLDPEGRLRFDHGWCFIESPKDDRRRYRNQLRIGHPLPLRRMSAYLSAESQYDFDAARWPKWRWTAGVCHKVRPWLSVAAYYRWDVIERSKRHGAWNTTQILGLKVVVAAP